MEGNRVTGDMGGISSPELQSKKKIKKKMKKNNISVGFFIFILRHACSFESPVNVENQFSEDVLITT